LELHATVSHGLLGAVQSDAVLQLAPATHEPWPLHVPPVHATPLGESLTTHVLELHATVSHGLLGAVQSDAVLHVPPPSTAGTDASGAATPLHT
jgi:hypothetical protein